MGEAQDGFLEPIKTRTDFYQNLEHPFGKVPLTYRLKNNPKIHEQQYIFKMEGIPPPENPVGLSHTGTARTGHHHGRMVRKAGIRASGGRGTQPAHAACCRQRSIPGTDHTVSGQ